MFGERQGPFTSYNYTTIRMKTLSEQVANEIKDELENLPENTDFNSTHEGLAIIQEEFEELKQEVFFGEKKRLRMCLQNGESKDEAEQTALRFHKLAMRHEATQIAAMCVRFIQELT